MEGGGFSFPALCFLQSSLCSLINLGQLFQVSDTCTAPFVSLNSVGLNGFD